MNDKIPDIIENIFGTLKQKPKEDPKEQLRRDYPGLFSKDKYETFQNFHPHSKKSL